MTAHPAIPAHVLAAAPRVWIEVHPGMRIRAIDPRWRRRTIALLQSQALKAADDLAADELVDQMPDVMSPAQRIVADVCTAHGVLLRDVLRTGRCHQHKNARFNAAYELKRGGFDSAMIGRLLRRDRTSILNAVKRWPLIAQRLGMACEPIIVGQAA